MILSRAAWLHWPQTKRLVAAFAPYPQTLRFVGGAVRDSLLGREVKDVDAATTLLPEAVMALLEKAKIAAIPTGIDHGTVTAVIDGKHFEITTLRKDLACDGRHADVAFTDNWRDDAQRRDFTMNAMYLSPEGELFDYFDGETDARAGKVRFIGDAGARIAEDYLRILRFFRFFAHYGVGAPDGDAVAACAAASSHIVSLSGERIQHELFRLLTAASSLPALQIMQTAHILEHIFAMPVRDLSVLERLEKQSLKAGVMEKLAAIFAVEGDVHAFAQRVKLSNATAKHLRQLLIEQHALHLYMTLAQQKKLLRRIGTLLFIEAVTVCAARIGAVEMLAVTNLPSMWTPPLFPITGADLIACGVQPGKEMGELLQRLEDEWEASDYTLTKEALLAKVK